MPILPRDQDRKAFGMQVSAKLRVELILKGVLVDALQTAPTQASHVSLVHIISKYSYQ